MTYVLIGGTGTLGKELIRQIEAREPETRIVSLSRDELKIQEAKREFPRVRFVVGDVRDRDAVARVLWGAKAAFLLAAIKHVDVAEENPGEAVKTNVIGAMNVAEAAVAASVPYVVYSNTDKAVSPITTYGYTKALAQNYLLTQNGRSFTRFSAFNWGNIAASRGSVIPIFAKTLRQEGKVYLTHPGMTRFWLRIEQAASFMLDNYRTAPTYRAMIPPVKGASVLRVARAVASTLGMEKFDVEHIGMRGTEKLHEVLDASLSSDTCEQFTDDELREFIQGVV
jgi:UDP-N-acetylglucosamine 4,6-dehydratase